MRVLTFTSLFPNRDQPLLGIFIFQRMSHFANRPTNRVDVIAPVPYFPRWLRFTRWEKAGQVPAEEKVGNLTVFHPRYFLLPKISMPFHGFLMFLGSLLIARRLHREKNFDCIDAHFVYPDGFAAVLLGRILRIPVIVSARGTDINLYPSFRLILPLIRWTLRHAAGSIAVSTLLRESMIGLGAKPENACVIGNGIDSARFNPVSPEEARKHLGLTNSAKIIVSVGALVPLKGFDFLISAFRQIAPRVGEVYLYIVGEGYWRSKLQSLIRACNVDARVTLVGSVPNEQLRYWFSAANLSCLVSSREGWANVLQESMACGTPVVATRVGAAPEIVVSPELGLLVDQDVQQISAALELAITIQWNRQLIAQHAIKRTWQLVAAEVEAFLSSRMAKANSSSQAKRTSSSRVQNERIDQSS